MIDHVYISHCEKLKDRLEYITEATKHPFFKNKTEIITFTEKDDLNSIENNSYVKNTKWNNELKNSEIFIAEQMFHIYSLIVKNNYKKTLILEDDFILSDIFDSKYQEIFTTIPEDFDCVFLSTCDKLKTPDNLTNQFWASDISRCTCGYIVSINFCKKMVENKNYYSPIDWHLNFIKKELGFKYYWSKDFLFVQGSENRYKSNLR